MSSFTENTYIAPLPKDNKRKTTKDFTYYVWEEIEKDIIVVKKWFVFDWASVPYIFWWFWQKVEPKTIWPACLHDWLYIWKPRSKKEADDIFYESLRVMKVNVIKSALYYLWVRLFGWRYRYKIGKKIKSIFK